jgi:hypothetical protein
VLPLRDKNPSGIVPWMVYVLIAANAVVFIHEISLPPEDLAAFIGRYSVVPERVTRALHGRGDLLAAAIIPALSSMFLHGGWLHIIGNMWFLLIFGDNVEARFGRFRFLIFYLFCGVAAMATQYALYPHSRIPTLGASGAIAGVLGAYLVRWPGARILTLVPFFFFIQFVELPAILVLGFWFLIQFFQGAASLGVHFTHGVAYWAHVGGFIAGAVLMTILPAAKGRRYPRG